MSIGLRSVQRTGLQPVYSHEQRTAYSEQRTAYSVQRAAYRIDVQRVSERE